MEKKTTIIDRFDVFMSKKGLNDNMVTEKAGLSVGQLGKARKAKGGLQQTSIEKLLHAYPDINPSWLMTGKGNMLVVDPRVDPVVDPEAKSQIKTYRSGKSGGKVEEPQIRTLIQTVDRSGRETILLVPVKAQAGYLVGAADPEYVESLPTFWLPGVTNGTYRAFEVAGYSMLVGNGVGFSPGDIVIGQHCDSPRDIKDGRIYVIVNSADGVDDIVLKRCLNRMDNTEGGLIWCKSDNRDYPMFNLVPDQIKEVWEFKRKITAQAPDPSGIYDRLNDLDVRVASIESEQKRLNK